MSDNSLNEQLIKSLLADRRSDRRWRLIRTILWLVPIFFFAYLAFSPSNDRLESDLNGKPYVSVVPLSGEIMPNSNFSAAKVLPVLTQAFKDKNARGVILVINSPGGSPVQASIIHDKIEQLKAKYHKKVIVLGEDALASGAYLISTAADKIYVNNDTVTGSIGVIMNGFGFVDTLQKLGITRRVFTAGNSKDRLDPFKPLNKQDISKVHNILDNVHQHFIQDVLEGRKGKLHGDPKELFSGDFWTGDVAVKLGLADGVGNIWDVSKKEFGAEHYRIYKIHPSVLDALFKSSLEHIHLGTDAQMTPFVEQLKTN